MTPLESARAALTAAESALDTLRTSAADAGRTWDARREALGPQPPLPTAPPREPVAPPTGRPTDDATAAKTELDKLAVSRALAERYAADLATAEADVERETAAHIVAEAKVATVEAVLRIAREMPTTIAREQVAALDDTGRVRFTLPTERNKQTPHIVVEYVRPDGTAIPFSEASTGEQEAAGAVVQARIRDAAAKRLGGVWRFVPIVVEMGRYNGGRGPYPDIAGPVVVHLTTAEGGMELRKGWPSNPA